jgi:hypothetical protein
MHINFTIDLKYRIYSSHIWTILHDSLQLTQLNLSFHVLKHIWQTCTPTTWRAWHNIATETLKLNEGHDHFLTDPFQLTVHSHPTTQYYITYAVEIHCYITKHPSIKNRFFHCSMSSLFILTVLSCWDPRYSLICENFYLRKIRNTRIFKDLSEDL